MEETWRVTKRGTGRLSFRSTIKYHKWPIAALVSVSVKASQAYLCLDHG
jgi:hypothetical protein